MLAQRAAGEWVCTTCTFVAPLVEIDGRAVPDLRAKDHPQTVALNFTLPTRPLDRYEIARTHFRAPNERFEYLHGPEIKTRFGTKLDKGIQFYCQKLLKEYGPDAPILDLGCGNGGNRAYLQSLGFGRVLSVDWMARGAEFLADAHRLPLQSRAFQMVIATAVFEHLYNPFVAMSEISRVLNETGCFVGSASFWEAWHGSSHFHLTPDGWNALLVANGLQLNDLWVGWGIIPAALSHVLTPGYLRRAGYAAQRAVEAVYRLLRGEMAVRRLQLRASGSYVVYAVKSPH